jgi:hypothetical protein
MAKVKASLFAQFEPDEAWDADSYDRSVIPAYLALDGFVSDTRYVALEGEPAGLTLFGLTDEAASGYAELSPDPLRGDRIPFTAIEVFDSGRTDRQGGYLLAVALTVPDSDVAELDDWYDSEHAPMLLAAPDWLRVRRYRASPGAPWTHLALHELANLKVLDSPERAAAREAPKRQAVANSAWYATSVRWLYEAAART